MSVPFKLRSSPSDGTHIFGFTNTLGIQPWDSLQGNPPQPVAQRYLVLMVTGKGMPMLIPDPAAKQAAKLTQLLTGHVNDFWREATHGAVSFQFDVYDSFVTL